jgi:oxygen-independent coproporphyrinogen-3 oxidase
VRADHLYVHVPFCARRCTYCDFSIAVRRRVPVRAYVDALRLELERVGRPELLATIYLGGGTPSLLGGEAVAELLALVKPPGEVAELTLEANPDDVTAVAARQWRQAGVNRVSLGAQSFDDRALAWMHRTHNAETTGRAVRILRRAGISNLSLDLIFALPAELSRDFARDLEQAIALEPEHISLYGLTIEPGTALARQAARAEIAPAGEDRYEAEYLEAHRRLRLAGYDFYEVSNACRPGFEALHNRAYWKLEPYLGVGPSAHSYDGIARWWNEPAFARWAALLQANQSPVAGREILNHAQSSLEATYLALRTREGLEVEPSSPIEAAARRWIAAGWAQWSGGTSHHAAGKGLGAAGAPPLRLALTPQGWLRLDVLVASL